MQRKSVYYEITLSGLWFVILKYYMMQCILTKDREIALPNQLVSSQVKFFSF